MTEQPEATPSALSGLKIVVTRAEHQADSLLAELARHRASPVFYPCVTVQPPDSWQPLDQALEQAREFDWLILTSAGAVTALADRLQSLGLDRAIFDGVKVAAIGSTAAQAAEEELGLTVHAHPDSDHSQALVAGIPMGPGARILLPQSATARPDLAQALTGAGARVSAVPVYRTFVGQGGADVPAMLWKGEIDVVTFTSSSTVLNFRRRLEYEGGSLAMLQDVVVACIGPLTATRAGELGLTVHVVPNEHTVEALVSALAAFFQRRRP